MAGNNRFFRLARRISVHLAIHPADQIKPPDECLFIHDALVIGSGLFWILGCICRVSGVSEIDMLEFPLIGCKPNKRDSERVLISIVCFLALEVLLSRSSLLQSNRARHFS